MDLLQMSLNEPVLVKMRHSREITGKLVAYDDHLNLMLSDTKENNEIMFSNAIQG